MLNLERWVLDDEREEMNVGSEDGSQHVRCTVRRQQYSFTMSKGARLNFET